MDGAALWDYLPRLPWVVLAPVAASIAKAVIERLLGWLRRGHKPSPEGQPEAHVTERSGHSAYRISAPPPMGSSRELEHHVAAMGLVPIQGNLPSSGFRSAWRTVVEVLFVTRARPKPGFRIEGWQCRPVPGSESIPGAFVVAVRLHPNENRSHLRASLRSRLGVFGGPCLVAIASVSDLFDEASWVRCYAVDPSTTSLDPKDRRLVGVQSYDCAGREASTCFRMRVRDAREKAVWLVVDNAGHTAPGEDWGRCAADIYEVHDDPPHPEERPAWCGQVEDDYRYIRSQRRSILVGRAMLWLVAIIWVPVLCLTGWVVSVLVGLRLPEWLSSGATVVAVVWLSTWLLASGAYLGALANTPLQALWWRRRDGQRCSGDRVWRGGTTDCVVFGSMVRRGRLLDGKDWKRFWLGLRPGD